jgi:hypothetical protein
LVTWRAIGAAGDDKACCDLEDAGSVVLHHHGTEQNGMVDSGIFEIPMSAEGKTDTDMAVEERNALCR